MTHCVFHVQIAALADVAPMGSLQHLKRVRYHISTSAICTPVTSGAALKWAQSFPVSLHNDVENDGLLIRIPRVPQKN